MGKAGRGYGLPLYFNHSLHFTFFICIATSFISSVQCRLDRQKGLIGHADTRSQVLTCRIVEPSKSQSRTESVFEIAEPLKFLSIQVQG